MRLTKSQAATALMVIDGADAYSQSHELDLDDLWEHLMNADRPTLSDDEVSLLRNELDRHEFWTDDMNALADKLAGF